MQKKDDFAAMASDLWSGSKSVFSATKAREALKHWNIKPDFTFAGDGKKTGIRYIHRRDGEDDIYFVANRSEAARTLEASFRVSGKTPELWDAVSGHRLRAADFRESSGHTRLSLELDPCGSVLVVFRPQSDLPERKTKDPREVQELQQSWTLAFDPEWGGPEKIVFPELADWTENDDEGIRHYSGSALYRTKFDFSGRLGDGDVFLDLGDVRELAVVTLNGKKLGTVWTPPFRVNTSAALKEKGNVLEVKVVNFWPNRIIGDAALPAAQRRTRTNILELKADTKLMPSGLLGPVRLLQDAR